MTGLDPIQYSDGNIVYDNVFKMFLDPDVYEALIGMQGGSSLITEDQPVFDNCGRVISTRTVVLQGDIATQPFDATLDASVVPIPAPALGDFKIREESGEFKVNLLSGTNPVITLIKGRSYNIALETETIGVNIVDPTTEYLLQRRTGARRWITGRVCTKQKSWIPDLEYSARCTQ